MAEQNQQQAPKTPVALTKADIGTGVINRVGELCNNGFKMPADFSYVNAVKMSILKLNDVKDKSGRPALEVCTKNSIATALFQMCTKGLNAALNQCYFIARGDQLTLQESYFGKVLQVKRIFPNWEPAPHTIREGDEFEFAVNPKTGHRILVKHTQTLESMDKELVGAYVILPTIDGEGDLYVMTKKQISSAWAKSSSAQHLTHKEFDEKMACKTVVNSGCNTIINSTPALNYGADDYEDPNRPDADNQTQTELETLHIGVGGVVDAGELSQPKKRGRKPKEAIVAALAASRTVDVKPNTDTTPKEPATPDDIPEESEAPETASASTESEEDEW